jgi:serine/threonine protein kinase
MNSMIVSVNSKYYTIQSKIGSGSYSKVYKATDSETKTLVAIKIITTSKLNASLIQRLSKEIEILKQLKHINIISLLNYSITDKHIYLVMDFCNGGTVGDKIGKLTNESQVKEIVTQILDGMLYLQNKNILHRDIKPANILLTDDNIIKIIDFGFSSDLKDNDMYSTICGTPMYMSPELLKCESYNKKTDLWSLGVITYELIHHKNPFGNPRNISQLLESIKKKNFYYKSSISPSCRNFITSLLQETPDLRPDLSDLLSHEWFSVKDIPSPVSSPLYDSGSDEDNLFAMDDVGKAPKKSESPSKLETIFTDSDTKEGKTPKNNAITSSKPIDIIKPTQIIENFFPAASRAQTIDQSTLHRHHSSPFTPSPIYKILKFSGNMIKNIFDYGSNNTY